MSACFHGIEHGNGGGQGVGQFLLRRRTRFLQMVGADIHWVPFRNFCIAPAHHIRDQPQGGFGREHIGAAREVFLHDVVLCRPAQLLAVVAPLIGQRHIKRQHPGRRRIDRHRRVHRLQRQLGEEFPHVAQMLDRHAYLADFAAAQDMVGVIGRLGRQVEGDGEAGLPLGEVQPVKLVGFLGGRMARIGAEDPGFVGRVLVISGGFCHGLPASLMLRRNMAEPPAAGKRPLCRTCRPLPARPPTLHQSARARQIPVTQPRSPLQTALGLRLASLLAFPAGAALMAIFQRSPLALALLTAAMLAVGLYERRRLAAVTGVQTAISGATLLTGFGFRLGLLIAIFVITVGLLALFRDTSLARQLELIDAGLIALPVAIALAANEISARIAKREFGDVRTQLTAAFADARGPAAPEAGGDIIEGEIIDADDPPERR